MATDYPDGLDEFTNPGPDDDTSVLPHHDQHGDANDAIEAIEATLGLTPQGDFNDVAERLTAVEGGALGFCGACGAEA